MDEPRFVGGRVTRYGLPPERTIEARRVARPVQRVIIHPEGRGTWPAGPSIDQMRNPDGAPVRPVHVAPPRRGVERVIVRPHSRNR